MLRGGPGSGYFDHPGRPGKVGGSLPRFSKSVHLSTLVYVTPNASKEKLLTGGKRRLKSYLIRVERGLRRIPRTIYSKVKIDDVSIIGHREMFVLNVKGGLPSYSKAINYRFRLQNKIRDIKEFETKLYKDFTKRPVWGLTNVNTKKIYLNVHTDIPRFTLLHEYGHIVDAHLIKGKTISNLKQWRELCKKETRGLHELFKQASKGELDYLKLKPNNSEKFADAFALALNNGRSRAYLKKFTPGMYKFIINLIKKGAL